MYHTKQKELTKVNSFSQAVVLTIDLSQSPKVYDLMQTNCRYLDYFLKYLLYKPIKPEPCLASSLAIS